MRSEKGVTMGTLIIYVTIFFAISTIIGIITSYYYKNIMELDFSAASAVEYDKLNVYLLRETKEPGNDILSIENMGTDPYAEDYARSVTFSSGNIYYRAGNNIYMNQIRLCEDVTELQFEEIIEGNEKILKTTVQFDGGEVLETNYVLELDKNIQTTHNQDSDFAIGGHTDKEIDITKLTDGSFNGKVCVPNLGSGMTAIILKDGYGYDYDTLDSKNSVSQWNKWYDYENSNWANAITSDGSMFVWIPRFEYKITYYTDSTKTVESTSKTLYARISINFISRETVTPTEGYQIHPAFRNGRENNFDNGEWDEEISGFWVAKYETSMEKNGSNINISSASVGNVRINNNIKAVSKPSNYVWNYISLSNAYYNSYNFSRNLESHLMKNSEWGAVAYLAYSPYGVDEADIEGYNSLITPSISDKTDSTTGNITGVIGMAGGVVEKVATYVGIGSIDSSIFGNEIATELGNGGELKSSKYVTLYENDKSTEEENYAKYELLKDTRFGDAILETSVAGTGTNSIGMQYSVYPLPEETFLRGGFMGGTSPNGIFSFGWATGDGLAYEEEGYRIILITD